MRASMKCHPAFVPTLPPPNLPSNKPAPSPALNSPNTSTIIVHPLVIIGKFHSALDLLNNQAIKKMQCEGFDDALNKLSEADQILDYAVNSGKTINKALIKTILHNKACVFQGSYDLPQLNRHLEAILYNYSCTLKVTEKMQEVEKEDFLDQNNRNF